MYSSIKFDLKIKLSSGHNNITSIFFIRKRVETITPAFNQMRCYLKEILIKVPTLSVRHLNILYCLVTDNRPTYKLLLGRKRNLNDDQNGNLISIRWIWTGVREEQQTAKGSNETTLEGNNDCYFTWSQQRKSKRRRNPLFSQSLWLIGRY